MFCPSSPLVWQTAFHVHTSGKWSTGETDVSFSSWELCFLVLIAAGSSQQLRLFLIGVSWFCTGGSVYIESHKMWLKANQRDILLFSYTLEGNSDGIITAETFPGQKCCVWGWRTFSICCFRYQVQNILDITFLSWSS